jgi:hypothetical protein
MAIREQIDFGYVGCSRMQDVAWWATDQMRERFKGILAFQQHARMN